MQPHRSFKHFPNEKTAKSGKVLREGEETSGKRKDGTREGYVIESLGERFLRVRALPGRSFKVGVGEEITVEGCPFVVVSRDRKSMLLEGLPE